MKEVSIKAEADDLSSIYSGTFAMTRGSTLERYELAGWPRLRHEGALDGGKHQGDGRQLKVLGIHMGTNFLDNPVLNAIERSTLWFGAVALAGLLVGFAGGWLFCRRTREALSKS
ncbi:MAG: hypothetical protein M0C28_31090 [Candidatus Moduliflexus flocculans]|nr:hypothetical protein [Candidatus Moduliflexus flocculans]